MSYEDNSYGSYPSPKTYEEKLRAWPEGRKSGILKRFNLPFDVTLDLLDIEREAEFERST